MILADTSVWIDHFRRTDAELSRQLLQNNIVIHPYVIEELALGSISNRHAKLLYLERLPRIQIARLIEVRTIVENHLLYRQGLGFVDAHLLASTLFTPGTLLWSHDKQLVQAAAKLGIACVHP